MKLVNIPIVMQDGELHGYCETYAEYLLYTAQEARKIQGLIIIGSSRKEREQFRTLLLAFRLADKGKGVHFRAIYEDWDEARIKQELN